MKVFINRNLLDVNDRAVKESNAKDSPDMVLGTFMCEALLRDLPSDQGAGAALKIKRWDMAKKITHALRQKGKEVCIDLPSQDIAMIQTRFAEFAPTTIFGPFMHAMENDAQDIPAVLASAK